MRSPSVHLWLAAAACSTLLWLSGATMSVLLLAGAFCVGIVALFIIVTVPMRTLSAVCPRRDVTLMRQSMFDA